MSYNYEDLSWSDVRDLFRKWRDENERKSDDVIQLWEAILAEKVQKLGNERHLVLEQVFIAALDCGRIEVAEDCVCTLQAEFPGSLRVQKYKAMLLEALERYDDALDVLENIIKKDETNAAPRKRKVAILKAKGRIPDAIKELCDYLKKFMSDQEAWHELCNLYLSEGEYQKAAFCMEELLLHNPHNHLINQRLAEIRYSMGGIENYEIARTYYSQAVKLNSNNLRALYGLYLCCGHIMNSKATITKRKEAQKLSEWCLTKISEITESRTTNSNKKDGKTTKSPNITALENAFGNIDLNKASSSSSSAN